MRNRKPVLSEVEGTIDETSSTTDDRYTCSPASVARNWCDSSHPTYCVEALHGGDVEHAVSGDGRANYGTIQFD